MDFRIRTIGDLRSFERGPGLQRSDLQAACCQSYRGREPPSREKDSSQQVPSDFILTPPAGMSFSSESGIRSAW